MIDNTRNDRRFEIIKIVIAAILAFIFSIVATFIAFIYQRDTIEKKTVETLSVYFEEVESDMSYEDAIKFLYESSQRKDKLIQALKDENAELKTFREQTSSEESNQEIIASASSFAAEEDYAMAYAILSSVIKKTPQMLVMIGEYQKKYEAQVIMEADSLIFEGNYGEATTVVDNALKVVQDSTILKEKKNSIKNSQPQKFVNVLDPYESSHYYKKTGVDIMQMAGEKYYDGFEMGHYYDGSFAVFNLNEKYTEITFLIGHADGTGGGTHVLRIIAENDRVLETIEIPTDGRPQSISIPVSGVNLLRFERTGGYGQTCLANIMIR